MRLAAISDIHIRSDSKDDALIEGLRNRLVDLSPDVFVIAGDISDRIDVLETVLKELSLPHSTNLYVAGNHDIWFEDTKNLGSLEKYSRAIGDVCKRSNFIHLPDEPFVIDEVAFVGSLGWYDYSFKREDLKISEDNYREKHWQGAYRRDYYSIDWSYTDLEFTELLNSKLKYDLSTLPTKVKSIVYISHHLPFRELILYRNSFPWDYFSAFMGAASTGQILTSDKRVVLSISGHSHIRKQISVGGLTAITVPMGYGRPPDGDFSSLIQDAIAEIKIEKNAVTMTHFKDGDICESLPYDF